MKVARHRFPINVISTVILLGLLIFFRDSTAMRSLRSSLLTGIAPMMRSVLGIRQSVARLGMPEGTGGATAERNSEEQRAQTEARMQALQKENDRLRTALGFKEKNKLNIKGSSVLFYGQEFGNEFLLIDQGKNQGIEQDQLVIDAAGILVGKVSDAEDSFAKISVASNPNEVYEVEFSPYTTKAFAKGIGSRTFSLEMLAHNTVIRGGDFVIVKTERGFFLAGEVQRVSSTTTSAFKQARAVLLAQPDSLKEVFVVMPQP